MRLTEFKVLSFDCYGTLVDWETGICDALSPYLEKHGLELSRDQILESFARHEAAQEAETPGMIYSELLARVHRRLTAEWGVAASAEDHRAFGGSVGDWPVFADTPAALAYLKRHYKLVILSNVDRASFAATSRRLGVAFDAVYTAEDIGSYKPDLNNFRYLLAALGKEGYGPGDVLHVAQSLFHDHKPANEAGLHSAWIDRRQGAPGWGATPPPADGVHWDFRFVSLAELVEAHRREASG
ncbi:MAG TPA: haloacid dehalogenase type II [Stellaceae bacterium]|nr:haloacid dehalogenase type II [Stellaceae bacterium]